MWPVPASRPGKVKLPLSLGGTAADQPEHRLVHLVALFLNRESLLARARVLKYLVTHPAQCDQFFGKLQGRCKIAR